MERLAVQSSEIAIVGYDPATKILELAFRRGGVYQYSGVSAKIYEELMAASSLGTYFEKNIKPVFQAKRLD